MTVHVTLASYFGVVGYATFFGSLPTETELSWRVTSEPWDCVFILGCSGSQFRDLDWRDEFAQANSVSKTMG